MTVMSATEKARPDDEGPGGGKPIPTPAQLVWQEMGLGVFFHFGVNTFAGVEWSDGTLPASSFAPSEVDADQWVRTAAEIGARYVVLTAKHHDGFCLWPTRTTDYSVASSPWRDGRGDVVAEVAEACRRHGLGLGLYLSPWDRNANCYSDPAAYDDFYLEQLAELCTGYGPLTELWFDGAGSQGRSYDWARIAELVSATQPDAMVFNMGRPTIRWVGNEDGLAEDPVQYVVASTKLDNYTTVTVDLAEEHWLPPECDVSLRRGWFFHPDDEPKSLEHLLGIHYRSIGLGAGLLLNLPPDTEGRIPDQDVARVREWRAELDRRFADPVPAEREVDGEAVRLRFARPIRLDHLELTEDIRAGQRILGHRVCLSDGTEVAAGQSVGVRRMHVLDPVTTDELVVWVSDADGRLVPEALSGATGFATGHSTPPVIPTAYRAPTVAPD